MALLPWRKGIVESIEQYTHNTRRFFIRIPELDVFSFKPGQFVTLDLPIHEKQNKRLRSYSIASAPDGSNRFELLIVKAPEGAGTTYLFEELKEGDTVSLRGPAGVFNLPENLDRDLFLICTGTGIAPFRSMIQYIYHQKLPHQKLYLVFGCRQKKDLLYYEEMRLMEKELPAFHYLPVLSRENWEGDTGYVHGVYERYIPGAPPALFFLCGWRAMVDEAKKRIQACGYSAKDIHLELYG